MFRSNLYLFKFFNLFIIGFNIHNLYSLNYISKNYKANHNQIDNNNLFRIIKIRLSNKDIETK